MITGVHNPTAAAADAQAWTRVQGDRSRGMSKHPVFLKSMILKFELALPFLTRASIIVDADERTLDEVVRELFARLTTGEPYPPER